MNENPYQAPSADLQPPTTGLTTLHEPRGVATGRGVAWVREGFSLFMRAPLNFALMGVLFVVASILVSLIPFLGGLAVMLFWPHINAGFYLAFAKADRGEAVKIGDLFEPFKDMNNLLGLGALYLAGTVVVGIVMMVFLFAGMGSAGLAGMMGHGGEFSMDHVNTTAIFLSAALAFLVTLALTVPLAMAFIFSPILVHQHQVPIMDAIKQSFIGCLRNLMPFLIWGLVWLGIVIAAIVVFLVPIIGWLAGLVFFFIAFPLSVSNFYVAYRDIYLH